MNLTEVVKRAQKLVVDNSPAILTVIGVTGTLATAYLTGRASFKAADEISYAERGSIGNTKHRSLASRDKIRLIWKLYIPAASTAVLTSAAIVGANRIGTRRTAALAVAYSLSERAFTEYREKVVERLGAAKEQKVRDEIAQDQVHKNPVSSLIITGRGDVRCYEAYTGRYFNSSMETLKKAQNDINAQVIHDGFASLSDFYDLVGLPNTAVSGEIGWTTDQLLELKFSTVMSDDDVPCISFMYNHVPIR